MADASTVFLPAEVYIILFAAFAVPVVMSVVGYFKRQGTVDTTTTVTDLNVQSIQTGMTEQKSEMKEVRKELQEISTVMHEMTNISQRVTKLEDQFTDHDRRLWPRVEEARNAIGVLTTRMTNIEDKVSDHMYDSRKGKGSEKGAV